MDYAPLVKSIQEGDYKTANRLIAEATPILIRMLKVRMNASHEDAEDAVQAMFGYVISAIREGKIENPSGLLSYMIITCRHSYLKSRDTYWPEIDNDQVNESSREPEQLTRLLDEEKSELLNRCLESLKDDQREFIGYWLQNPETDAADVARHFGITVSNAWTRKHRVIRILQNCIRSKF